jgi:hypothetical protein
MQKQHIFIALIFIIILVLAWATFKPTSKPNSQPEDSKQAITPTATPPASPSENGQMPTTIDYNIFVGMTVEEAEAYAQANGILFRVGKIDGEPQMVTMDYRPGRITADVENGIIVGYSVER